MVGRGRWEEIHRRAGAGGSVRVIARELRPRPEDGAPLLAADGVEAVPAGSAGGHVAGLARGVSAAPGGGGGLLGAGASPGAPAAEVPRQLYETVKRFVRPLRETKLHAAVTRTRFETPPGAAEPERLGAGAGPSRRGRGRCGTCSATQGASGSHWGVPPRPTRRRAPCPTTILRRLLGVTQLHVENAHVAADGPLAVWVRPSWRRSRCGACGRRVPRYDRRPLRQWRHVPWGRTPVWLQYAPWRVSCRRCGVRVERVCSASTTFAARVASFEDVTRHPQNDRTRCLGRIASRRHPRPGTGRPEVHPGPEARRGTRRAPIPSPTVRRVS